jgi:hypothetical protein
MMLCNQLWFLDWAPVASHSCTFGNSNDQHIGKAAKFIKTQSIFASLRILGVLREIKLNEETNL